MKYCVLNFKKLGLLIYGPLIFSEANAKMELDLIFSNIKAPILTLTEIFIEFWLDINWNCDPQRWALRSLKILEQLFGRCKTYNDYKQFIDLVEQKIFYSCNVQASLLLLLQLRVLRIQRTEQCLFQVKRVNLDLAKEEIINDNNRINGSIKTSSSLEINDFNNLSNAVNSPEQSFENKSLNESEKSNENFLLIEEDDILFSYESGSFGASAEWFSLLTEHLVILSLLQILPANNENQILNSDNKIEFSNAFGIEIETLNRLTLERMGQKGFGFYREQIGVWSAERLPNANELAFILNNNELSDNPKDSKNIFSENIISILNALQVRLPESLSPELTLCDCCWECVSAWAKDKSRRVTKLRKAIDFLKILKPVPRLQQGIASIVWNTFLRNPFQKLYEIMNQQDIFGSNFYSSIDRVLKRDVLIVESDLLEFVNCVRELLRALANSTAEINSRDDLPPVEHFYESCIEKFFAHPKCDRRKSPKTPTLSELGAKHKKVNYYLVLHHIHLTTSMYLMVNSGIRVRPISLFDSVGQMAFFTSFNSHPLIPLANVDDRTKIKRQTFLEKIVEQISTNGIGSNRETKHKEMEKSPQYEDYFCNWNFIIGLGKDWELDIDLLKTREISMLYEFGFDKDAEKLILEIEDKHILMQALLPRIAARIKQYFNDDPKLMINVFRHSSASDSTMDYIKNISDVFSPKFDEMDINRLQRMIYKTNKLAKAKPLELKKSKSPTRESSIACGSAYLRQRNFSTFDLKVQLQMLHDFVDISNVLEKLSDTN